MLVIICGSILTECLWAQVGAHISTLGLREGGMCDPMCHPPIGDAAALNALPQLSERSPATSLNVPIGLGGTGWAVLTLNAGVTYDISKYTRNLVGCV